MSSNTAISSAQRYQQVLKEIKITKQNSRDSQTTLIAVSKTQSTDAIEELYQLGHRDFGENYAQEMIQKARELIARGCTGIRWHFIGHLQTNKVKLVIPYVSMIHTLNSEKLAKEIAKQWSLANRQDRLPVFIEVNLDHEANKSGIPCTQVTEFTEQIHSIPELDLQGLMCIPLSNEDPRTRFALLRELEWKARPISKGKLSMGMSKDFKIALQEGATHIRIGTALFGSRQQFPIQ